MTEAGSSESLAAPGLPTSAEMSYSSLKRRGVDRRDEPAMRGGRSERTRKSDQQRAL